MPPRIPLATYRLQLTSRFTLDDAAAVLPYLGALGISHVYASPVLRARAGSTHGYDGIDYAMLNPELGREAAFARLSDALKRAHVGLILDFVPNHMAVHGADNLWWLDVLEWGPQSPYAAFFDIDWKRLPHRSRGTVLLPLLGRPYGEALAAGEIELKFDSEAGSFSAWYFDHRLPIAPRSYGAILRKVVARGGAAGLPAAGQLHDLARRSIVSREDADALKRALATALVADLVQLGLRAFRPAPGEPAATAALHRLLERQHYRVAHWRLAASQINYRRFFDIDSLAGLRVEHPPVFDAVHRRVFALVRTDQLQGLRVDHIDGLWDPHQYCNRLQHAVRAVRADRAEPFYAVVEKILEPDEPLPEFPGIAGTTGYEWLSVIARVLIDRTGLSSLARTWSDVSGETRSFAEILLEAKRYVLVNLLASEFATLANLLARIAAGQRDTRDFIPERLRAALELFVLHFPVYRTYVTPSCVSAADRAVIARTIATARRLWGGPDDGIFEFLQSVLTLDAAARGGRTHSRRRIFQFVGKLQQFTGPMMAKSLEDTAFYRYHAVLPFTEVGGRPDASALTVDDFHTRMRDRVATSPHGLTTTATHDTKRGEDARARLLALAELPREWDAVVRRWLTLNSGLVANVRDARLPTPAHEYLLYQALLGAWPVAALDRTFIERVQGFMRKAAREGKQQTSWIDPDPHYEGGLDAFIATALDAARSAEFLESFGAFARRIALLGALNSLSQLTLKLAMPGVPDIYQGCELWDLSFVDPDNRRPVDFPARAALLKEVAATSDWRHLVETWNGGAIKLALLHHLLEIRKKFPHVFDAGDYQPVPVRGASAEHVIAFARSHGADAVLIVIGRLFASLTDGGRRWPRGSDWQGEIVLEGYEDVERLGPAASPASADDLSLPALFDTVPIAILRARPMHVRK